MSNTRRLAMCALPVLWLLEMSFASGQQAAAPAAAPQPAPGAPAAPKNLQVLTDLKDKPRIELISAMQFMSGSLSVSCNHCHVSQSGPYDSDANTTKNVARDMIRMTRSINETSFGGRQVVTCNTCHQGKTHPAVTPDPWYKSPDEVAAYRATMQPAPTAASTPPAPAVPSGAAVVLPTVDEVFAAYRKAVAASPVTSIRISGINALALGGQSAPFELEALLPDRASITTQNGTMRTIINGSRAWRVTPQGATELPSAQVDTLRTTVSSLVPIKFETANSPRTVSGVETVSGRRYYVVESHPPGRIDKLYVDVETRLPLKIRSEFPTVLGTRVEERAFDDYRTVSGITLAYRVTSHYMEDQSLFQISEVHPNIELDPARFEPPRIK
jgi:hypothetical protein